MAIKALAEIILPLPYSGNPVDSANELLEKKALAPKPLSELQIAASF
jgi:hypothetical protein